MVAPPRRSGRDRPLGCVPQRCAPLAPQDPRPPWITSTLVKLGNDMLTDVRRRVSWDIHGRRGCGTDLAWAHRLLLLRGYDTPSIRG